MSLQSDVDGFSQDVKQQFANRSTTNTVTVSSAFYDGHHQFQQFHQAMSTELSPYLTGSLSPLSPYPSQFSTLQSPELSSNLSHLHLDAEADHSMPEFNSYPQPYAQSPMSSQTSSLDGTGHHAHVADDISRPAIYIQTVMELTPFASPSTSLSSAGSPLPPTPNTPNFLPTQFSPAIFQGSLPYDQTYLTTTINPVLLKEPEDVEQRGRRSSRAHRQSVSRGDRSRSPLGLGLSTFEDASFSPASASAPGTPLLLQAISLAEDDDEDAQSNSLALNCQRKEMGANSTYRRVVASPEVVSASKGRRTTKTARHKCTFPGCSADFTARHNLINHMNSHLGIKKYDCDLCDKKFTTSHVRNRHRATCRPSPNPRAKRRSRS